MEIGCVAAFVEERPRTGSGVAIVAVPEHPFQHLPALVDELLDAVVVLDLLHVSVASVAVERPRGPGRLSGYHQSSSAT